MWGFEPIPQPISEINTYYEKTQPTNCKKEKATTTKLSFQFPYIGIILAVVRMSIVSL